MPPILVPAPAHDCNHRVATELLGNYVQSVDFSVSVDRAQYRQSIKHLSRRSTKSRRKKLTDKKRLAIKRKYYGAIWPLLSFLDD